jgi:hypothetical protein
MAKQAYSKSNLVVGYALCSSLLAIINKYAITKLSYPALLIIGEGPELLATGARKKA